jgi:hypothetical protein
MKRKLHSKRNAPPRYGESALSSPSKSRRLRMNSTHIVETTLKIPVTIEFIKAAVRDRLNTFKIINDSVDNIHDLEFGEVTQNEEGNDIVTISLGRTVNLQGGAPHKVNAASKKL